MTISRWSEEKLRRVTEERLAEIEAQIEKRRERAERRRRRLHRLSLGLLGR
jgi:hypothetical protein